VINISSNDIVKLSADVVVNSANPALGGIGPELPENIGGVDGAIHRAAGIELWSYLQELPVLGTLASGAQVRCWPGQCVVTPGFGLPVHHIVHGVAPIFDLNDPARCFVVLRQLYVRIFATVAELGAKTVAVPPIGTRSYGFPVHEAAKLAFEAAKHFVCATGCCLEFSVIDKREYAIYRNLLQRDLAIEQSKSMPPSG
jgi:O-acetyl-ADP-ribose deacetylase